MAVRKTPTQKSLAYLRALGWECHIVEKWNPFAKVRQDAFGFGDILACKPGVGIALIQTTSLTGIMARWRKIAKNPQAKKWKQSRGAILLHGWKGQKLREEIL